MTSPAATRAPAPKAPFAGAGLAIRSNAAWLHRAWRVLPGFIGVLTIGSCLLAVRLGFGKSLGLEVVGFFVLCSLMIRAVSRPDPVAPDPAARRLRAERVRAGLGVMRGTRHGTGLSCVVSFQLSAVLVAWETLPWDVVKLCFVAFGVAVFVFTLEPGLVSWNQWLDSAAKTLSSCACCCLAGIVLGNQVFDWRMTHSKRAAERIAQAVVTHRTLTGSWPRTLEEIATPITRPALAAAEFYQPSDASFSLWLRADGPLAIVLFSPSSWVFEPLTKTWRLFNED